MFAQSQDSTCPGCDKQAYFNERVRVLGSYYHKRCFKCEECSKVLTLGKHLEHDNKPYCQSCHSSLFGPRGFGFGTGVMAGNYNNSAPTKAPAAAPKKREKKKREKKVEKSNSFLIAQPDSDECYYCGESVYFSERLHVLGHYWHPRCFRCYECDRIIEQGKHVENKGEPYCSTCYVKHHGPKGYGHGIGAGIMASAYEHESKRRSKRRSKRASVRQPEEEEEEEEEEEKDAPEEQDFDDYNEEEEEEEEDQFDEPEAEMIPDYPVVEEKAKRRSSKRHSSKRHSSKRRSTRHKSSSKADQNPFEAFMDQIKELCGCGKGKKVIE